MKVSELKQLIREEIQNILKYNKIQRKNKLKNKIYFY